MRASIIGLALLWGIAAHAQQPAPTKTTELQARSYILSAFVTGIAGGVICHFLIERPLLIAGRRLIGRA